MRILILLSLLTLVACTNESENTEVQSSDLSNIKYDTTHWENGNIKEIKKLENGQLNYLKYYSEDEVTEDGTLLLIEGGFRNDKREGEWKWYNTGNTLWQKGSYVNGKREGEWIAYYLTHSEVLQDRGNYVNGEREGKFEYYDTTGTLIGYDIYKNGKLIDTTLGKKNK